MTIYPEIRLKKLEGINWQVIEECLFMKYDIIIEEGFVSDLVSSTRIFWAIIPPHGAAANAAIVHDYLCRNGLMSRKKCDDVFLELLKESGIEKWQYYSMYSFVRIFGWATYKKDIKR